MKRSDGIIVAIDGPTASGKSTTARLVAERLRYLHLNTGAMYRAFAVAASRANISPADRGAVQSLLSRIHISFERSGEVLLSGEDISREILSPTIASLASEFSALADVRAMLVSEQRRIGATGGVVLEGRDIGTVVFPDAELKIFLVANPEVRAERRHAELGKLGTALPLDEVERQLAERDRRDEERELSPLRKAEDAVELDTTGLSVEEQVERVVELARTRERKAPEGRA